MADFKWRHFRDSGLRPVVLEIRDQLSVCIPAFERSEINDRSNSASAPLM